jgi:hypothetical protein
VVIDEIRGRQEDPANLLHEQRVGAVLREPLATSDRGHDPQRAAMTPRGRAPFIARHYRAGEHGAGRRGGIAPAALRRAVDARFPDRGAPRARAARRAARGDGLRPPRRQDLSQAYLVRLDARADVRARSLALSLAIEIVGADPGRAPLPGDPRAPRPRLRRRRGSSTGATGRSPSLGERRARRTSAAPRHVERTCRERPRGFSADELDRAREEGPLPLRAARRLAHGPRVSQPASREPSSDARRDRALIERSASADVSDAWRRALGAPTLTRC